MKKKTVLAMFTTMAIMASTFVGCGTNTYMAKSVPMNQTTFTMAAFDVENVEDAELQAAAEAAAAETATAETEAAVENETAPASASTDSNSGSKPAANTNTKPSENTGSGGGSKPSSNTSSNSTKPAETKPAPSQPAPAQTQPSAPAHEHNWQEHVTVTETWVPNIVTVDDYELRDICVGHETHCNCGAVLSDSECEAHAMAHILAGECDATSNVDLYEPQNVKVGSHEEDHGHMETSRVIDYYYCECGARK